MDKLNHTNQSSSPTKKRGLGLGDKARLAPYFKRYIEK